MFDAQTAFREIANGDEDAFRFMNAVFVGVHVFDDLLDRDNPPDTVIAVASLLTALSEFSSNPFYQRNVSFLWPIIHASALTYLASEWMAKDERVLEKIASQALKAGYSSIFFAVAHLTGGFSHAVNMQRKFLEFSFDFPGKP